MLFFSLLGKLIASSYRPSSWRGCWCFAIHWVYSVKFLQSCANLLLSSSWTSFPSCSQSPLHYCRSKRRASWSPMTSNLTSLPIPLSVPTLSRQSSVRLTPRSFILPLLLQGTPKALLPFWPILGSWLSGILYFCSWWASKKWRWAFHACFHRFRPDAEYQQDQCASFHTNCWPCTPDTRRTSHRSLSCCRRGKLLRERLTWLCFRWSCSRQRCGSRFAGWCCGCSGRPKLHQLSGSKWSWSSSRVWRSRKCWIYRRIDAGPWDGSKWSGLFGRKI